MALQRCNLRLQFHRKPDIVRVQKSDKLAMRFAQRCVAHRCRPTRMRQVEDPHARGILQSSQISPGIGLRAVVRDDQFPVRQALGKYRFDRGLEKLRAVECRQNNGHGWGNRGSSSRDCQNVGSEARASRRFTRLIAPGVRSNTCWYIAASFEPSESNDSSRSKCARTAARNSESNRRATDRTASLRAPASLHGQSIPAVPAPVSERKEGMSVTTGGSPQAIASIKENPVLS